MRARLPELRRETVGVSREETRDKDWSSKLKEKAYTDDKRCAVPRSIRMGDTVLLRAEKSNKLSGNFYSSPSVKVAQKTGSEIPVRNDVGVEFKGSGAFLQNYFELEAASRTGGGACTAELEKKESAEAGTEEGQGEEDHCNTPELELHQYCKLLEGHYTKFRGLPIY